MHLAANQAHKLSRGIPSNIRVSELLIPSPPLYKLQYRLCPPPRRMIKDNRGHHKNRMQPELSVCSDRDSVIQFLANKSSTCNIGC